jgi:hypothetical protein
MLLPAPCPDSSPQTHCRHAAPHCPLLRDAVIVPTLCSKLSSLQRQLPQVSKGARAISLTHDALIAPLKPNSKVGRSDSAHHRPDGGYAVPRQLSLPSLPGGLENRPWDRAERFWAERDHLCCCCCCLVGLLCIPTLGRGMSCTRLLLPSTAIDLNHCPVTCRWVDGPWSWSWSWS